MILWGLCYMILAVEKSIVAMESPMGICKKLKLEKLLK